RREPHELLRLRARGTLRRGVRLDVRALPLLLLPRRHRKNLSRRPDVGTPGLLELQLVPERDRIVALRERVIDEVDLVAAEQRPAAREATERSKPRGRLPDRRL